MFKTAIKSRKYRPLHYVYKMNKEGHLVGARGALHARGGSRGARRRAVGALSAARAALGPNHTLQQVTGVAVSGCY